MGCNQYDIFKNAYSFNQPLNEWNVKSIESTFENELEGNRCLRKPNLFKKNC